MDINFEGYGENVATFKCDGTVEAGKFVDMSSNYTVTAARRYSDIFGYCIGVKDGYAAIQLSGYVEVESAGGIPVGIMPLAIDKEGKVFYYHGGNIRYKVIYSEADRVGFIL